MPWRFSLKMSKQTSNLSLTQCDPPLKNPGYAWSPFLVARLCSVSRVVKFLPVSPISPISAHVFTANHITHLATATLSTDQSNRWPGFLNFQLTNTTTWLWRWLPHRLSKRQSLTKVLLRTPITQMIFFNQGMFLLGSNHFLISGSIFATPPIQSSNSPPSGRPYPSQAPLLGHRK